MSRRYYIQHKKSMQHCDDTYRTLRYTVALNPRRDCIILMVAWLHMIGLSETSRHGPVGGPPSFETAFIYNHPMIFRSACKMQKQVTISEAMLLPHLYNAPCMAVVSEGAAARKWCS